MEMLEEILEEYRWHYKVEAESYRMMGKLLDEEWVKGRTELFQISDMYIYGGTYLAAQLCRAVRNYINIKGIIDRGGRTAIAMDIPVFTLDEFEKIYADEHVIITLPGFYREVRKDLLKFMPQKKVVFLGEFLEGFVE